MVVRLHPGQTNRLSAYLEDTVGLGLRLASPPPPQDKPSSRTWLAEVQAGDSPSSICGLEISFSSVPQDIDIKVIPGAGPETQGEVAPSPYSSSSSGPLVVEAAEMIQDENKTRE
jgi:hypothetical protein